MMKNLYTRIVMVIRQWLAWIFTWLKNPPQPVLAVVTPAVLPFLGRPGKWVKPKGAKPKPKSKPRTKTDPKPKAPRPQLRGEDPEQYGQYYFRDAILDQLDVYFTYLKRMKKTDRDAYNKHSRVGIQIMPQSAVNSFDKWRRDHEENELSAWWKTHRPAFGAVSYGIDKVGLEEEKIWTANMSPEQREQHNKGKGDPKILNHGRIATMTGGKHVEIEGEQIKTGVVWVPKFLYFNKWEKPPATVQKCTGDGDVYSMTVYWDRTDGLNRAAHRSNKSGVSQSYAIFIERGTGKVRALRMRITEKRQSLPRRRPRATSR